MGGGSGSSICKIIKYLQTFRLTSNVMNEGSEGQAKYLC
jgi:hypothetical protein